MALPPWTVELLRRGVADLARQVTDHDTAASLKEQASKLVEELPKAARDKVDSLLRQAEARTQPLKDAWQSSPWWGAGPISVTPTRVINGTGCLLDPRGSGVGLPAAALAAAIPHLSGEAAPDPDLSARLCDEIAACIHRGRVEGSRAPTTLGAIVTNSLDASLALVGTLGDCGGCLWVPRSAAHPMRISAALGSDDRMLVDRLRRFARGRVREFGHASGSEHWPDQQLLRHDDHPAHSRKGRSLASHEERTVRRHNVLVRLPSSKLRQRAAADPWHDWTDVVVVPVGSIFPIPQNDVVANVVDQLGAGADVVILAGGVLSGTPELSLIVGREEAINRLRQRPRFQFVRSPIAMTAMVAATTAAQANGNSPVGQLTAVSEENLNDRAQRLATQLAGCDWVSSTRVTELPASIGIPANLQNHPLPSDAGSPGASSPASDAIASRQVVLTIEPSRDAKSIAQRFASGSTGLLDSTEVLGTTGLLCSVDGNELSIDLRWISPDQQSQIGELASRIS